MPKFNVIPASLRHAQQIVNDRHYFHLLAPTDQPTLDILPPATVRTFPIPLQRRKLRLRGLPEVTWLGNKYSKPGVLVTKAVPPPRW